MRILIYSYHYYPEQHGIAPLITELAEGLVKRGHNVRVATPIPKLPQMLERYQGKWFFTELINGVVVQRSYTRIRPEPTVLDRFLQAISFTFTTFIHTLKGKRPDVILIISPPLSVSIPAILLGWIYRCAVVLNLEDIFPDSAVHLGLLNNPKLIRLYKSLEKFVYRRASKIIVTTESCVENLQQKRVREEKIVQIPKWVDVEFIKPLPKEPNEFRAVHQLNGKFVVMYSGNIPLTTGRSTLIETAVRLRYVPDISIVIVGQENALIDLQQEEEKNLTHLQLEIEQSLEELHVEKELTLKQLQLFRDTWQETNLKLLPFQPREKLPEMLAAADVALVIQKSNMMDFYMPSKIPLLMASSRAIVASVPQTGTAAKAIERSESGIVVPPENPNALAAAILELYCNSDQVNMLGEKGRHYAAENYSLEKTLDHYERLFTHLVRV